MKPGKIESRVGWPSHLSTIPRALYKWVMPFSKGTMSSSSSKLLPYVPYRSLLLIFFGRGGFSPSFGGSPANQSNVNRKEFQSTRNTQWLKLIAISCSHPTTLPPRWIWDGERERNRKGCASTLRFDSLTPLGEHGKHETWNLCRISIFTYQVVSSTWI